MCGDEKGAFLDEVVLPYQVLFECRIERGRRARFIFIVTDLFGG